jgi:hypothetical protein
LELSSEKNHTFITIWKSWFSYEPPLLLAEVYARTLRASQYRKEDSDRQGSAKNACGCAKYEVYIKMVIIWQQKTSGHFLAK